MCTTPEDSIRFSSIYNRTEKRIRKELNTLIDTQDSRLAAFTEKDLLDVFAIACTSLPAKYVHKGTIVIGDGIKNVDITLVLNDAIEFVRDNPKV